MEVIKGRVLVVSESSNHDHTLASPEDVSACCGVLECALICGSKSASGEEVQGVVQIPGRGFVEQWPRWSGKSLLSLGITAVMVLVLVAASSAQVQGDKPPIAAGTPAPQAVVPRRAVPLPPPAPVGEPTLPVPPTVQWDGKLLTVDAENSKLSDVLIAIRDRTGAKLELSGDPAQERVFVHLGPGPAREIISDLLYGTQFDYIVLASDDDPDALRSVVVTPRGRDDISINAVVAGAADTDPGTGGKDSTAATGAAGGDGRERAMRMMPGYSGPSKPTFQAEAEAALAEKAAQEDTSATDTGEASANAQNPTAASAGSQETKNDQASSSPAVSSAAASSTGTDLPPPTEETPSSSSAASSSDPTGVGSMIQNMTKMFEQRRQIQAQQNQPPQQPSN